VFHLTVPFAGSLHRDQPARALAFDPRIKSSRLNINSNGQPPTVRYEVQGQTAVITLDGAPTNSLNLPTRRALLAALTRAATDSTINSVILAGGEKIFCAGADINEFAGGLQGNAFASPSLADLIEAIESSGKPVIAAVSGVCFGGGLELALGCHARVATHGARFALPEIKLGLLPGAGGTQRLPRIIGVKAALSLILSGEPIGLEEAAAAGLVEVAVGDLIRNAAELAIQIAARGIAKAVDRPAYLPPDASKERYFAAQLAALKRPRPAAVKCVQAVRMSVELPLREGLRREFEFFRELMQTPESQALRYAFLSDRAANRIDGVARDTAVRPIARVAVIGAGTMGTGIAMCTATVGLPTILIDLSPEALRRGHAKIVTLYDTAVKKGRLTAEQRQQRINCISTHTDLAAIASADLIIEAVFEELDVKQKIFRDLDEWAGTGAILASNTSTLDLNAIASVTQRPRDVVGLHFFSPANVMRLLEIVRGERTAPDVLATAMAFARKIQKIAVVAGVCDGFIGNRMFEEYLRQAGFLLDEGALPSQVDAALESWGMAMGPFAVMDLAGGDIAWAIRQRRALEQPGLPYSKIPDLVYELGRFGQKTGAGFYRYDSTTRARERDAEIEALVKTHSRSLGLPRRSIDDTEIVSRCVLALVNEGAKLLAEGIAQRASDIDVVYRNGYGFPAERGGPMYYADQSGLAGTVATMRRYASGYHGELWEPATLLLERLASGRQLTGV
jgi:3-hydroxyacyl-CoA dehydrogenase